MKNVLLIALVIAGLLLGLGAWIAKQNEAKPRQPEAGGQDDFLQQNAESSWEPPLVEQEAMFEGKPVGSGIKHLSVEDDQHRRDDAQAPAGLEPEAGDAIPVQGKVREDEDAGAGARQGQTNLGRAAIPTLVQALQDRDEGVRMAAAAALGNLGPEAIPALIQALGKETVAGLASHALAQIGSPAVPQLVQALKEENTCLFAFNTLCAIGLPAVPALIEATKSDNGSVRQLAEMALQQILKPKSGKTA